MKRETILWISVLTGPIVWFSSLEVNFALSPVLCGMQSKAPVYWVSIASLAITALSGMLAWRQWREVGRPNATPRFGPPSPLRWLAIAGMSLSCFSFLVILAQTVPIAILAGCE
jgi:hypothetical protein